MLWEGFAEKVRFKPGMKEWVGDGIPNNSKYDCWQTWLSNAAIPAKVTIRVIRGIRSDHASSRGTRQHRRRHVRPVLPRYKVFCLLVHVHGAKAASPRRTHSVQLAAYHLYNALASLSSRGRRPHALTVNSIHTPAAFCARKHDYQPASATERA